jgi:hypothetical protein
MQPFIRVDVKDPATSDPIQSSVSGGCKILVDLWWRTTAPASLAISVLASSDPVSTTTISSRIRALPSAIIARRWLGEPRGEGPLQSGKEISLLLFGQGFESGGHQPRPLLFHICSYIRPATQTNEGHNGNYQNSFAPS